MPEPTHALINFGELTKPATVLIEKISDALGGAFRPKQIERVAKAEAKADIIKASAKIEIDALQRRALERFVAEEAQKQQNIEEITRKALPDVKEDAKPENVEKDWITNFFDKCRLISDEEMQNLWAKLLAGEANSPGRYSKRCVNLLSGLDKTDAEFFKKLCSFKLRMGAGVSVAVVYDVKAAIYAQNGLNFSILKNLDSIGLIQFESIGSYKINQLQKRINFEYYGSNVVLEFPLPEDNTMQLGNVLYTNAGMQLSGVCGAPPISGFAEYLKTKWQALGYKVEITVAE